jgi:hypothetical protein
MHSAHELVLFAACPASDEAIEEARTYIKAQGFTQDHVKIKKTPDCVTVISKAGDKWPK